MRRLSFLQGLRGLAALMVVFHHYLCAFFPFLVFGVGPSHGRLEHLFWVSPLGLISSGSWPVCLFFILSGFVLSLPFFGNDGKETRELLAAMVKRPVRLVGMVAATMIVSMAMLRTHLDFAAQLAPVTGSKWLMEIDTPPTTWIQFARDLLTDPFGSGVLFNPPLWTISFELIGSYITFLFVLLFRRSPIRWLVYLIMGLQFSHNYYIGFIVGTLCADLWKNHPNLFAQEKGSLILVVPLLLVGIYLASFQTYLDPSYSSLTWHGLLPRVGHSNIYPMAGACAVFVSLLLTPLLQGLFSIAPLVYLGRISYAMYAIHLLALRFVSSWIFLNVSVVRTYEYRLIIMSCASILFLLVVSHIATVYFDEKVIKGANALAAAWKRQAGEENR
jgi:peptidoglycan/LPS O-acetylase OafA/YrhL